jgi:hypothetical protein
MGHFTSTLQQDFGMPVWETAEGLERACTVPMVVIDDAKGMKVQNLVDVAL